MPARVPTQWASRRPFIACLPGGLVSAIGVWATSGTCRTRRAPHPEPFHVMPSDHDSPAALCSELLLAYQSSVVHDLRGDLNGLLLTLDFLRRQLAARPDTATLFSDSLGDLDNVRGSLTKTLNQLESVGHARRVIGGRDQPSPVDQNLAAVASEVLHALGDRIRRRGVTMIGPQSADVVVHADPVLLRLALHRVMSALVDLTRNAELEVGVDMAMPSTARVRAVIRDARMVPADLMVKADDLQNKPPPIPNAVLAMGLSMKLAQQMGGRLRQMTTEEGTYGVELEMPVGGG
jgi:hypothetical protein